ncbi:MAG: hypothetical protein L6271_18000 [Desulfobacteraceae bacterium]|nr:hypothetical protein [Desulfobacteraceae bacterium]
MAVDQVIVAVSSRDDNLIKLLLECMQNKIKVSEFRRVIEEITGRVPIDHLNALTVTTSTGPRTMMTASPVWAGSCARCGWMKCRSCSISSRAK